MTGQPAARISDPTAHTPLTGAGCPTVLIGGLPAWRAVTPAGAAGAAAAAVGALTSAKATSDAAIEAAEAATLSAIASGNPVAISAAQATEASVKAASAASMSAMMTSTAASLAGPDGPPDLHTCPVPLPIPPHGPGLVTAGSATVFIGGFAAARAGDQLVEALGPPNSIVSGCPTVLIG